MLHHPSTRGDALAIPLQGLVTRSRHRDLSAHDRSILLSRACLTSVPLNSAEHFVDQRQRSSDHSHTSLSTIHEIASGLPCTVLYRHLNTGVCRSAVQIQESVDPEPVTSPGASGRLLFPNYGPSFAVALSLHREGRVNAAVWATHASSVPEIRLAVEYAGAGRLNLRGCPQKYSDGISADLQTDVAQPNSVRRRGCWHCRMNSDERHQAAADSLETHCPPMRLAGDCRTVVLENVQGFRKTVVLPTGTLILNCVRCAETDFRIVV